MRPLADIMRDPIILVGAFGLSIVLVSLHTDLLPRDFWLAGQTILTVALGWTAWQLYRRISRQ